MNPHQYHQMYKWLVRPKDKLSKVEKKEVVKDFYKKAEQPKSKPMPIVDYIKKVNSLYSNSEDPKYIDPKEMEDIKKSLPVSEMVKEEEHFNDKILKRDKYEVQQPKKKMIKKTLIVEKPKPVKPPIIDYLELQDWLNEIDPQWWEEEPKKEVLLRVPKRELKGLASLLNVG